MDVLHLRSNLLSSGKAKAPIDLPTGKIALNYKSGYESLFIKNDAGSIVALNDWSKILNKPTTLSGYGINDNINNLAGNLYTDRLVEPAFRTGSITNTARPLFDVLRGDRTAFLPAEQIIVEYSTDAGITWTSGEISDSTKRRMFTGQRPSIAIPLKNGVKSTDCMMRITVTGMRYNVPDGTAETEKYNYWNSGYVKSTERYFAAQEAWMWVSSNSDRIHLKIERASGANSTSWITDREAFLSGWSGGNYISMGGATFGGGTTQTGNFWNYRFTFRTCSSSNTFNDADLSKSYTTSSQTIHHIKVGGANVWSTPNNYMYNDHLYSWDEYQNATFPGNVTAASFVGNASSATKLATTRTIWGQNFNGEGNVSGNISIASAYINGTAGKLYFGGNFHIDSIGGHGLYLNFYNGTNTIINAGTNKGNVGIGTTSPTYKLDIYGDVRLGNSTSNGLTIWNGTKGVTLTVDESGNLKVDGNLYATGEVSAYGSGSGSGSGSGIIQSVLGSAGLGGSYSDTDLTNTFNAYTINLISNNLTSAIGRIGALETSTPNVAWGTPTTQLSPLTINAITRSLSVDGHTHDYLSTLKVGTTSYSVSGNSITIPAYPTTLPASDVYSWAKASVKPSYSFSEIGSKPTTLSGYGITDALNTSSTSQTKSGGLTISGTLTANSNIILNGVTYNMLTLARTTANGSSILFKNSSGNLGKLGFDGGGNLIVGKGETTDGVADLLKIATSGAATFYSSVTASSFIGNASSATKLQTSRTIWGQNFDGSGNISGDLNGVSSIIRNHAYAVDSDVYGNLNWKAGAESWFNWNVGGILNVNKSGNVGIGIELPTSKLHVIGEIRIESHNSNTGAINIQGNSTSCGFGFGNTESVNNMGFVKFKPTAVNSGSGNNRISFDIYGNDDIVNILGNGNVGIGTISPSFKLDINGTTRIFGGLHLNSEGWLQLYNGANTSTISLSHNSSSSKLDIYNRTLGNWANIECGFINSDTITMKNNMSEKFIRSNAWGGAIRIRANSGAATDRGLQLGRVDNNLSFTSFMAINGDSGNVSINSTLDNGYKLDVAGTFRVNYNYSTTFTGNDINFTRTDGSSYINAGQTLSLGAGGTSGVLNLTNSNVATFKELLLADGARIYSTAGAGLGISLFNEPSFNPNYGLMFAQTVYKGKHGAVSGDWATYFTMSPDAGRGWIFTNSASSSGGNVASISNTGNLTCSGEVTAYSASDRRLKTDIVTLRNSLRIIELLNPVSYKWNSIAKELNPMKGDENDYGLIAQELECVMPELVHSIYDGKYKSIDYVKLIPHLVCAIKELKMEVDGLKK